MLAAALLIAALLAVSVGLGVVQFRRETPLAFTCVHCSHQFEQPPHLAFPRRCPRCRATDWARPR